MTLTADLNAALADLQRLGAGVDVVFGATTVKGLLDQGSDVMADTGGLAVELVPESVLIRTWALLARIPAPPAVVASVLPFGSVDPGTHAYRITYVTALGETDGGAPSNTVTTIGGQARVGFTLPIGPVGTTARKIYRTAAGGTTYKLLATVSDNTTTDYTDSATDSTLGATLPTANTSGIGQGSTITVGGVTYKVRELHLVPPDGALTRLIVVR